MARHNSSEMRALASAVAAKMDSSFHASRLKFTSGIARRHSSGPNIRRASAIASPNEIASAVSRRLTANLAGPDRRPMTHASGMASAVAARFASAAFKRSFASHVGRKLASAVAVNLAEASEDGKQNTAMRLSSAIAARMFARPDDEELPAASEDMPGKK